MIALRQIIASWLVTLRSRPDSEHEMTLNRLVFATLVIVYLGVAGAVGQSQALQIFNRVYLIFIAYIIGALALFAHILYRPMAVPSRRVVAAIYDMAMISYAAAACGETSGFFYPLYLWTIFGNGFRFGVAYLFISMSIGIIGFTVVIILTGFGSAHVGLSAALLVGLVMLPTYVSRLIRKLSEAKRQAEAANRAKSQFLASVSHELRTPLNAIIGLSSLFDCVDLDHDRAEMIQTIGAAGRTLLGHINSILDLSRIEAGKILSQNAKFDLHELLVYVKKIVAVQRKDLRVSIHITSRTPNLVVGTRKHLEEILLNLAGNAVKFTPSGNVVIGVDALSESGDRMRLRFEISDTGIGIPPAAQERIFESFAQADNTIIDRFGGTGLGLALCKQLVEAQGGRIGVESSPGVGSTFWFEIDVGRCSEPIEPYYHEGPVVLVSGDEVLAALISRAASDVRIVKDADEAVTELKKLGEAEAGRGAVVFDCGVEDGLAESILGSQLEFNPLFVRRLQASLQGFPEGKERSYYITTISKDAKLTELANVLKMAAVATSRKALPKQSILGAPFRRKLSVLVADDNRTNQMVTSKVLERAGHSVTVVGDGSSALEALRCNSFDVALMDLNMPVLNGIEAFEQYRNGLNNQAPTPVIAFTADATEGARARCKQAGFQACATKPIEPARLLELVSQITQQALIDDPPATLLVPKRGPEGPNHSGSQRRTTVKREKLRELDRLGGRYFVEELIRQFAMDGEDTLKCLRSAVQQKNIRNFYDQLHAMRSAAGNIGAESLYDICLSLKQTTREELDTDGEQHLRRLAAEIDRVRRELSDYLAEPAAA